MCWMCDEIDQAFEDEMDVSTRVWWKPWTWFLPSRDEYANQYHPGYETCQNCGRLICYDFQGHDDVTAMPYVTCAGDLFCSVCGPRYDEPEDEDYDELD